MTVDILCRVVDNLGDIGFAYRLARALSELPDAPRLRLVVDDLAAFAGICPGVDPGASLQSVGEWLVARWADPGEDAVRRFLAERPRMVLECYACGRPDWFESILFDAGDPVPRTIVNIEYLTAESWARDFHKLPSLTRSPLVRKAVFMPGFEAGTGGLLQDSAFSALVAACASRDGILAVRRELLGSFGLKAPYEPGISVAQGTLAVPDRFAVPGTLAVPGKPAARGEGNERFAQAEKFVPETAFWFLVFSYEHDFSPIVGDLAVFHATHPVLALVAAGRSSGPFLEAWNRAGCPFPVLVLPLLPQKQWDAFLAASDFTVVRGEETLARACLSGHPFLWQCYPFADACGSAVTPAAALPGEPAPVPAAALPGEPAAVPAAALPGEPAPVPAAALPGEPAPVPAAALPGELAGQRSLQLVGQLPKVYAFLERIKPFLDPADFVIYERLTLAFNGVRSEFSGFPATGGHQEPKNPLESASGDLLTLLRALECSRDRADPVPAIREKGGRSGGFAVGFDFWSRQVRDLGNMAVNLLTFMHDLR